MSTERRVSAAIEEAPPFEQGQDAFVTSMIEGSGGIRACHGPDQSFLLFLPVDGVPAPGGIALRSFRYGYEPAARLLLGDGSVLTTPMAVISFDGPIVRDLALLKALVTLLLELLGAELSAQKLDESVRVLVDVFSPIGSARGSVLGLWGEVVFLLENEDIVGAIQAWHSEPNAKFDFAWEGRRVEVKTTQSPSRVHDFDFRQLMLLENARVEVASIVTTRSDSGTSLSSLIDEISSRLAHSPLLMLKVIKLVSSTLGARWAEDAAHYAWDREHARDSLRMIPLDDLPCPPFELSGRVVGVRVRVDCDGLGTAGPL